MLTRLGVAVLFVALVATAAATLMGCGSSGSAIPGLGPFEAAANCEIPVPGASSDKVRLENSGIPCQEAVSMALLLTTGRSSQAVTAAGVKWTCSNLPRTKSPLLVRCRHGRRHFSLERGSP